MRYIITYMLVWISTKHEELYSKSTACSKPFLHTCIKSQKIKLETGKNYYKNYRVVSAFPLCTPDNVYGKKKKEKGARLKMKKLLIFLTNSKTSNKDFRP